MNKMSGLGLSMLTIYSAVSLSSNMVSGSVTSNIAYPHFYESVSNINDASGVSCLSSNLGEQATGDIFINKMDNSEDYLLRHEREVVQLKIMGVTKHISKFDFEEVYEEL